MTKLYFCHECRACHGRLRQCHSYLEAMKAKEDPASELPITEANDYWRKRALFIVIQARAGDCYSNA